MIIGRTVALDCTLGLLLLSNFIFLQIDPYSVSDPTLSPLLIMLLTTFPRGKGVTTDGSLNGLTTIREVVDPIGVEVISAAVSTMRRGGLHTLLVSESLLFGVLRYILASSFNWNSDTGLIWYGGVFIFWEMPWFAGDAIFLSGDAPLLMAPAVQCVLGLNVHSFIFNSS